MDGSDAGVGELRARHIKTRLYQSNLVGSECPLWRAPSIQGIVGRIQVLGRAGIISRLLLVSMRRKQAFSKHYAKRGRYPTLGLLVACKYPFSPIPSEICKQGKEQLPKLAWNPSTGVSLQLSPIQLFIRYREYLKSVDCGFGSCSRNRVSCLKPGNLCDNWPFDNLIQQLLNLEPDLPS